MSIHEITINNECDTLTLIVPLLHRMSNLESLALYLVIDYYKKNRFIDGNHLKKNLIDHLPRLTKFAFNIRSKNFFRSNAFTF